MDKCLDKELLERYLGKKCSESKRLSIEAHISKCEECRRLVMSQEERVLAKADNSSDSGQPAAAKDSPATASMPYASDAKLGRDSRRETPPSTYEGYQILEEMPLGGQAIVYKAIHKATKMKVALKVLPPGLSISAKARRHFELEVELAASLNHPNIVTIRDSGIAKGQHYFSMEYVRGKALDVYASSEQLSFRERIVLFTKVCDAMSHAHQRGVIHRDLKPSNILVDDRGEPRVLDFGLAKAATSWTGTTETASMPTMTGHLKGTVAFMSPEQAGGRSDLTDVRTDVYSLGVILYLLLTGRLPYDVSGSIAEALDNIQNEDPVRPRQLVSKFDSDVEAILLKSLAKHRANRYQSAAELLGDLNRWLDDLPIVAKSVSSLYVLRKIVSRHQYTAKVVGLLVVIVLAFSYVSYYLYAEKLAAGEYAERYREALSEEGGMKFGLAQQYTFLTFLEVWHNDGPVGRITSFMGDESKERIAATFLLDPTALAEKEDSFHRSLSDELNWFKYFVIGESHFKDDNREEALKAYKSSYEAVLKLSPDSGFGGGIWINSDMLVENKLKARLYELGVANYEEHVGSSSSIAGQEK